MLNTIHPHVSAGMSIMLGVTGKKRPEMYVSLITPTRIEIAAGRNMAIGIALQQGCDYIFFLDDDTVCPADTLIRLVDRLEATPDIHTISPMYRLRTYPYKLMAFVEDGAPHKWKLADEPYDISPDGLIRCLALGNGCTMMRMSVFRDILQAGDSDEFFRTAKHHTEDTFFCAKARNIIPGFTCAMDTTFSANHMLGVSWLNEENLEYTRAKAKLVVGITKDSDRLAELKDMTDGWIPEDLPLPDLMESMDYDGSLGRV